MTIKEFSDKVLKLLNDEGQANLRNLIVEYFTIVEPNSTNRLYLATELSRLKQSNLIQIGDHSIRNLKDKDYPLEVDVKILMGIDFNSYMKETKTINQTMNVGNNNVGNNYGTMNQSESLEQPNLRQNFTPTINPPIVPIVPETKSAIKNILKWIGSNIIAVIFTTVIGGLIVW